MKKLLIIICIIIPLNFFGQPGYWMLKKHQFKVGNIKKFSKEEIDLFKQLLDTINKLDQFYRVRNIDDKIKINDSITFILYKKFCENKGYYSVHPNILNQYSKDKSEYFSKILAFHLHLSGRYGINILEIIENSIKKETCNENDLMDYFITYLSRKTEFDLNRCGLISFHIIILPDLINNKYANFYKYALHQYLNFCIDSKASFLYFSLNNVEFDTNKNINFNNVIFNENNYYINKKILMKLLIINKKNIEDNIRFRYNKILKDNYYSVLFCTHPYLKYQPLYELD